MAHKLLKQHVGDFLPHAISDRFSSLDGTDVAEWLHSIGETVLANYDTGRCGLAVTESGYQVSTNGYVGFWKNGDRS